MARDVARGDLYRATINLWVEDTLTRAYLSELWNDTSIAFLIGGGNEGVNAVVKEAETSGFDNVFALIDRDFRPTNQADWLNPKKTARTFVLPVHEIENYLLHAEALGASRYHNPRLSAVDIENLLVQAAQRLAWWVAGRSALAELRSRFRDGFIGDPPQSIDGHAAVCHHICSSSWFQKLAAEVSRSRESDVESLVKDGHDRARKALSDGSWRIDFAGKEIFKDVLSRICHEPSIERLPRSRQELLIDISKEVAAWQVENDAIPPALADLRAALRMRVGL